MESIGKVGKAFEQKSGERHINSGSETRVNEMKFIQGDCLEAMKTLPDNSVDLTVTSPPYDNLRTYNGYVFDFEGIAKELYRVTKDGGVVVWVVGDATIRGSETGTSFKQALFFKEIGFNLHDTMIYMREGPPLSHNRYEQKFEYMFVLSNGKPSTFNGMVCHSKSAGQKRTSTMRQDSDSLGDRSAKGFVQETKLVGNVFEYSVGNNCSTKDKIAHRHPAIFPEQLAHDHIISWSNEGDTVLDPMMGSGTTGKMAKILNRKFIGIEISTEYFDIATRRIEGAEAQEVLPL